MPRASQTITLYPDSDVDTGWTPIGGGGTRWETVDDGVGAANDDTNYVITTADLAVQTLGVQDLRGANTNETFDLHVEIRYRNNSDWVDDTHDLRVRILKGATQISTETLGVTSTSYVTDNSVAPASGVTLTQSEIDDLRIELMFDKTVVGGNDASGIRVTACELVVNYIPRVVVIT